ncbi:hypothetical protein [Faecalicatena contorta]
MRKSGRRWMTGKNLW